MKASEALIAWTPADYGTPTAGTVKVGPLIEVGKRDWSDPYAYTGGASIVERREMVGAEAQLWVFTDFHTIVVRDGIKPEVAHEAFLAIDEYAYGISPDIEGARDPEDDE